MSERTEVEARPHAPSRQVRAMRSAAWQALLLVALSGWSWSAIDNAARNMRARGIPTDFDFWNRTAGFDINATLIPFSAANNTYGDAFYVGLLNTLVVSACGIVFATIIGFLVGVARLSKNWMIGRLAGALRRGHPQHAAAAAIAVLVQRGADAAARAARSPSRCRAASWINNRGLFLPDPRFRPRRRLRPSQRSGRACSRRSSLRGFRRRRRLATGERPARAVALAWR